MVEILWRIPQNGVRIFQNGVRIPQTKVIFYKGKNIAVDRDFFSGGSRSPPLKGRGRGGVSNFFH